MTEELDRAGTVSDGVAGGTVSPSASTRMRRDSSPTIQRWRCGSVDAAIAGQPHGSGRRRDRTRLSLRLRAARRPAGGVRRTAAPGRGQASAVVIHTREADDDTFRILRGRACRRPRGGVFHCFTGDRDGAARASTAGFHISLAGIVTFPRALELQKVAAMVPLDRLLIETDSPFLAPVPHRGKRNEPAHVVRVAEVDCRSCAG